jgi:hypothetical protein
MTKAEAELIIETIKAGRAFAAGNAEHAWGVECRPGGALVRWRRSYEDASYGEEPIDDVSALALFQGYSFENIRRWLGL